MRSIARQWLNDYKNTLKCAACGEDDSICLSFHHLDPGSKTASIYKLVYNKECKVSDLKDEIAKCIVLCFNCHLKYHRDKREHKKFNDIEELSSQFGEEGLCSLWSEDDDGS